MNDIVNERQVTNTVIRALANNRGVFIGEDHTDKLAAFFVASHMRELKQAGVTTLYVEYNALKARAAQGGQECREQFIGPSRTPASDALSQQVSGMQYVIEMATAAGLRVIGHDSLTGNAWQWDRTSANPRLAEQLATGGQAMDARDDYAARLINATYDGKKFVVYGGSAHSGNEITDRPSGRGLSERLGIHSFDFSTNAGLYFEREGLGSKLGSMPSDIGAILDGEARPTRMRRGVNGESTIKVYAQYDNALAHPRANQEYAALDQARIEAAQKAVRDSGVCQLPPLKATREIVPLAEAIDLANSTNPPARNPSGGTRTRN